MAKAKNPETGFGEGGVVKMNELKSSCKLATIIKGKMNGKDRWPMQMNFGDEWKASLHEKNLKSYQKGNVDINVVKTQSY